MTADAYSTTIDRVERVVLVGLLGLLAYRLIPGIAAKPANLVFLASEAIVILLVSFRRRTTDISRNSADWVFAFAGTLLPLLVVRSDAPGLAYGTPLLLSGFVIAVAAQWSLFRSFGVVAANRGVRTRGLYGLVRHPMYLGYLLTNIGFLVSNPSPWNAAVCVLWAGCQLHRIHAEERVLGADAAYVVFANRVRYRLIPFVY